MRTAGKSAKAIAKRPAARTTKAPATQRVSAAGVKQLVLLQAMRDEFLSRPAIGPRDVDNLLAKCLKAILAATRTDAGSILINERDRLVFRACAGPGSGKLIGTSLAHDEGIAGWVFRSGKAYTTANAARDAKWNGRISQELRYATRSILATPLKTGGRVIGVIELINKKGGRPFGRQEQQLLEGLAGQIALDVAYAGLLSESLRDAWRRAQQVELALVLNSSLTQREIRTQAIQAVTNLLDAEVGSLLLVDEQTQDLFFEVALGEKEERVKQMRLRMGEGIAGWVAANDQPALINDVQNDPRYFRRAQTITNFITRNMVCVPVRSKGRVIGVLEAINKKGAGPFTGEDLENGLMLANQVAVALESADLYTRLRQTFVDTAEALAAAVEKRDPYTGGHIKRVVEYSMAIARHLPAPLDDGEDLRLAAVLHDIGKIGIKDSVLLKQARLNDDEQRHMQQHPLVGEEILKHIEEMQAVRRVLRSHHEKWDGTGYPDGLRAERIPLHARIIAIADTFDAITTDRPYRKAADWKTAIAEIKRCAGTYYDPVLVKAFARACTAGDVTIVRGR